MAFKVGSGSVCQAAKQTTWGTPVAPSVLLNMTSESIQTAINKGDEGNLLASKIRKKVLSVMPKHPYLVVFCFSLIPLPVFDIVGLIAGAMKLNQAKFFASCLLGKLIKMASFAWMANYIIKLLN